jgi:hypothetical protein
VMPNYQAHRRQWSAAELPSGAVPCYAFVFSKMAQLSSYRDRFFTVSAS